jgi:hypothetical protein
LPLRTFPFKVARFANHLQQPPAPANPPVVNVVALAVILVMFVPIYIAQRLAAGPDARTPAARTAAPP